ncbi:MAG: hypothetical protein ACE14P_15260 [Methanotrichaceae archaeon]
MPHSWHFAPDILTYLFSIVISLSKQEELGRIGHELKPLEIVVVNILERGVHLTGVDNWFWDRLFIHANKKFIYQGAPDGSW